MEAWIRFPTFVVASYVVFGAILHCVLRRREREGLLPRILVIGVVVIIGGMVFRVLSAGPARYTSRYRMTEARTDHAQVSRGGCPWIMALTICLGRSNTRR